MADPTTPSPPMPPEEEKALLEIEKLKAEIAKAKADILKAEADTAKSTFETDYLKRPWYRKSHVLQPLAVVCVTVVGAILGFANGFFQAKLEKIAIDTQKAKAEGDKAQAQVTALEDRRSALNQQIAKLGTENEELAKSYGQVHSAMDNLQKLYADASARASAGENYRHQAGLIAAQMKIVQDALDARKWHEHDIVSVVVLDRKTGERVRRVIWRALSGAPGEDSALLNMLLRTTLRDSRFSGKAVADGEVTYTIKTTDIAAGKVKLQLLADNYRDGAVTIFDGTKSVIAYLDAVPMPTFTLTPADPQPSN